MRYHCSINSSTLTLCTKAEFLERALRSRSASTLYWRTSRDGYGFRLHLDRSYNILNMRVIDHTGNDNIWVRNIALESDARSYAIQGLKVAFQMWPFLETLDSSLPTEGEAAMFLFEEEA